MATAHALPVRRRPPTRARKATPPPSITWPGFSARILELYAPPLRGKRTHDKMRSVLRQFSELAGVLSLDQLDPLAVARYVRALADRRAWTISGNLGYVRAAARAAVACGWLERDPFAFRRHWATAAAEDEPDPPRHNSAEEIRRLLTLLEREAGDWLGLRLYSLVATVAYTGLRRNEALYLRVVDVDLDQGVIWVRKHRRRGVKTFASAAPVPIAEPLAEVLRVWLPRTGSEWAFPTQSRRQPWTSGGPGQKPLDRLHDAALRAGAGLVTWQSLRHSWASHAESLWGLSELQIQRVLRHTTPRTQQRYRHADVCNLRRLMGPVTYK